LNGYLLDTHVWIWFQRADLRISPAVRDELLESQRKRTLFLSPISTWELALLVADGYIDVRTSVDQFVETATEDGGLQLAPLTPRILIESTRLPGTLHRDPADRILAATARELGLTLVSRDQKLLRYGRSGHIRIRKP
jgi:PIN domain nuclease of toxin-antitoxin system